MINFSFKQLVHALALSEELNFQRAADRVYLTQSALSRSIQGLEDALGTRLFERNQHGVSLTGAGVAFIKRARLLLNDVEQLKLDLREWRKGEGGQVAFGVGPLMAEALIPALLAEVRARYPALRVQVMSNHSQFLLDQLKSRKIDFFIADTRLITAQPDLDVIPLQPHAGSFMCRSEHPLLLEPRELQAEDLLRYGFYTAGMPETLYQDLKPMLALSAHQELPIIAESNDLQMLKTLTLGSDAILLATFNSVQAELARHSLVPLALDTPVQLFAEPGIVSLKQQPLPAPARTVIEILVRRQHPRQG